MAPKKKKADAKKSKKKRQQEEEEEEARRREAERVLMDHQAYEEVAGEEISRAIEGAFADIDAKAEELRIVRCSAMNAAEVLMRLCVMADPTKDTGFILPTESRDCEPEPIDDMAAMWVPDRFRTITQPVKPKKRAHFEEDERPKTSPGILRRAQSSTRTNSTSDHHVSPKAKHRDFFRRADVDGRGCLKCDDLHAWLTMQSPVTLTEIKAILSSLGLTPTDDVGPDIFASVLLRLQRTNPNKWADDKLTVFPVPDVPVDPQALADERELRDILAKKKGGGLIRSKSTPFVVDLKKNLLGSTTEEDWAKVEVVNGLGLRDVAAPTRSDRLHGIAAQVKISTTSAKRPTTSQPPLPAVETKRPATSLGIAPSKFVPQTFSQASLVETHDFVPEAGVSAVDRFIGNTIKTLSRSGPTWPADPKHMSRADYDKQHLIASRLAARRRGGGPSSSSSSKAKTTTKASSRMAATKSKSKTTTLANNNNSDNGLFIRTCPDPIIGRPSTADDDALVSPHRPDILADLLIPSTEKPSFSGGVPGSPSAVSSTMTDAEATALERLDELEAAQIRELRGDAAVGHGPTPALLPIHDFGARRRQQVEAITAHPEPTYLRKERGLPQGMAMRAVQERCLSAKSR